MRTGLPSGLGLILAAVLVCGCGGPTAPTTSGTTPAPEPIPSDFVWSSAAQLGAWVHNGKSSGNIQLLTDEQGPFVRIQVAPPTAFVLQGPDLPIEGPPITGIQIVYRFEPAEPRHPLNVFYAFVYPRNPQFADDRALLGFGLDSSTWTTQRNSPIGGLPLPSVARAVVFTATVSSQREVGVTPGTLDIRNIQLLH